MTALYDIIVILPFSLLTVMLLGGYTGMPAESIIGMVICLISSLWIIMLRHMKKQDRLRGIGVVCVFLAGLIIAAGEENRRFLRSIMTKPVPKDAFFLFVASKRASMNALSKSWTWRSSGV